MKRQKSKKIPNQITFNELIEQEFNTKTINSDITIIKETTKSGDKKVVKEATKNGDKKPIKETKLEKETKPKKEVETVKESKLEKESEPIKEIKPINNNPAEIIVIPRNNTDSILTKAIKNRSNDRKEKEQKVKELIRNPYIRNGSLLTEAEKILYKLMDNEFNTKLKCISEGVKICPKVRLADIFSVNSDIKNKKDKEDYLYKIAYKHIDYLICDNQSLNIICAVELDDMYHDKPDRKLRDDFVDNLFKNNDIKLFRINVPIKTIKAYDISNILDFILDFYSPICKKCGGIMAPSKSTRKINYGHRFYGCTNWKPDRTGCDFTIDID